MRTRRVPGGNTTSWPIRRQSSSGTFMRLTLAFSCRRTPSSRQAIAGTSGRQCGPRHIYGAFGGAWPYSVAVEGLEVNELLRRSAPDDVQATIAWLSANGYTLTSHGGEGTFGAQFVYSGDAQVVITVDRSQWMLDVAPRRDAE